MANQSITQFPRRDADGRAVSLAELLAAGVFGTVVGVVALVALDGVFAVLGIGAFGQASGWLAAILPLLLYFDDLRGWRGHGARFLVAVIGAGVAIGLGLIAAAVAEGLPNIVSGAVGAIVASIIYAPVWFLGVRWLTGHDGALGRPDERRQR